jgi:hypothetical protein
MTFFDNQKRMYLLAILFAGLFLASSRTSSAEAHDLASHYLNALEQTSSGLAAANTVRLTASVEPSLADVEPAEVATSLAKRVDLSARMASTILTERVAAEQVVHYLVNGEQGQELRVALDAVDPGANFSIYGVRDRQAYKPLVPGSAEWTGILPSSQDYLISVAATDTDAEYAMFLELIDLSPFARLEPAQFRLPSGETAGVVSGLISADTPHRYTLHADAGQIINLELKSNEADATFGIQGISDQRTYKWLYDEARAWSFIAPDTQDYLLTVATNAGETDYALTVTLP